MKKETVYAIKKILRRTCWIVVGIGAIILMGAAANKKSLMVCQKVEITIKGVQNNIFIDEKDVDKILHSVVDGEIVGKQIKNIDLPVIVNTLQKNDWINKAEVYFDNNEVLWVNITEREPIARLYTRTGQTFYIDGNSSKIPVSEKFSARLPVFTGLNDSNATKEDTLLLTDIRNISRFILSDPFWMAQIDQVNIAKDHTFEMVPKIGNQVLLFGNADHYLDKFHYLFLFYKNVLSRVGWNKYSTISVQYNGQIIAVKRGVNEVKMDSLRTAEIMRSILLKAQLQTSDTSLVQLMQKDEPVQQVIPLINSDLPDENISLFNTPGFKIQRGRESAASVKDTTTKRPVPKDSIIKDKKTAILSNRSIQDAAKKIKSSETNGKAKVNNVKMKKVSENEY